MTHRAGRRTFRTALATAAALAAVTIAQSPAQAAWPGANGRIAFALDGKILSVQPSGRGQQQLTAGPDDHNPRWSPDGKMLTFERSGDIWVMHADGSHQQRLTSGPGLDISPTWSPNGKNVLFVRADDASRFDGGTLMVKPVAGGRPQALTSADDGCPYGPNYTPDGRWVVFTDDCEAPQQPGVLALNKVDTRTGAISTIIPNGGIPGPGGTWTFLGSRPDVTPDGRYVVFSVQSPQDDCDIAITDLSGAGLRNITTGGDCGAFVAEDPAVSPDGRKVAFTAGAEVARLAVALVAGNDQLGKFIVTPVDFPHGATWQPK